MRAVTSRLVVICRRSWRRYAAAGHCHNTVPCRTIRLNNPAINSLRNRDEIGITSPRRTDGYSLYESAMRRRAASPFRLPSRRRPPAGRADDYHIAHRRRGLEAGHGTNSSSAPPLPSQRCRVARGIFPTPAAFTGERGLFHWLMTCRRHRGDGGLSHIDAFRRRARNRPPASCRAVIDVARR